MAGPLLETKFHVPAGRRGLLPRPRLSERLSRGAESALTLVSAPAGFGKTTLLAEWLSTVPAEGRSVAWLSVDRRDSDPALFWTYVVTALQAAEPAVGAGALALLQSAQSSTEAVLSSLLNDLAGLAHDVVLVLDDYHLLEARDVQDGMAFLLEHLPPRVHLVIATRADPSLPLARLRARGDLVEVRVADLRFTRDEVAAYLEHGMGLELTSEDVATLEQRTEGWIAALQLAALSLQGRHDAAGFIEGFAGDDRYIVDYLAEEVLQRQSEQVRTFLLRTSVLSRLSGGLCEAVTGQDGGRATLEALDRANLFLVRLDDRRQWYRYHHLFADVLRARLVDEEPERLHELHRRASEWWEHNSEPAEAVQHALDAEDFERAASLVELALPAMRRARQEATLRRWLEALPEELLRCRPVLTIGYVGSLMARGELEGVQQRLDAAERWLDAARDAGEPSADMVVVDQAGYRALPGSIAVYRAGRALVLGDVAATMTHARRALDLAVEDDHLARGAPAALLGLAYWTGGHLDTARRWYADATASLVKAGHHSDALGGALVLADIAIAQGRLRAATSALEEGLELAGRVDPPLRGAADMHVGLSAVLYERNDLDGALRHLLVSRELGEHAGLPQNRYRWRVAMARIRAAEGDRDAAVGLLDEAERLYVGDFSPDVRPVAALRARVRIRQGRWAEALGWTRDRGLSSDDELSYLHEFEHLTLARALVGRYTDERDERTIDQATGLLGRLLAAADDGSRTGSLIDGLAVQALASQVRGDLPAAIASLHRALALAEPEGHVRVFVDEGPPMAALLRAALERGPGGDRVRRLLAAFDGADGRVRLQRGLVDPLSTRELDVLRLLATDLAGPDIARELVVSLNTVRTHTKNIYAKLAVNNRRAAVRRAEELDLTSSVRGRGHRGRGVPER
ncbi:LuxR family transcriptional regulator, maltose regulon positive regulatory protein [Geodermatophilus amargosae]|uniref:LuxR family transcriptional regulator, maltose regulon positive regulatory protein n=1 Tax=Geodermatophilus amargosae TaxID=1296565 RepID=A0A1I6YRQ3_9ACTN|nr:LuxR C-terminal-related transcriptional regulator [Geodermatophilus amargosae]SFT53120.1 LuxR family transcriptional regulator, maltose regulon positive regulatory protein [Geodermatophilus amargosae]